MMKLLTIIRQAREKRGWTQKQLADAIGVTPSFITKLEAGQTLPGNDLCLAMADALGLSLDELLEEVENARAETSQHRIRTRGAAVRGALRTRGARTTRPAVPPDNEMSAEEIAREIAADDDLRVAYQNLKLALADPQKRQAVLVALEAFARAARPEHTE
jgi:transcriptional regulator with XRE-family HTH domain